MTACFHDNEEMTADMVMTAIYITLVVDRSYNDSDLLG